jgi:hypothetical protein
VSSGRRIAFFARRHPTPRNNPAYFLAAQAPHFLAAQAPHFLAAQAPHFLALVAEHAPAQRPRHAPPAQPPKAALVTTAQASVRASWFDKDFMVMFLCWG